MLYGRLPLRVVIGVRRDVYGYALVVQSDSCKRHVALPADEAAHRAPRCLCNWEVVLIRIAPHNALRACRLELAVHLVRTVRLEDDVAVVKCPEHRIALRESHAYIRFCISGRLNERCELLFACHDGSIIVLHPVLAAGLSPFAHTETKIHPDRISRNEQLRENDQFSPAGRRLLYEPQRLIQ